jgi:hypothetical protein
MLKSLLKEPALVKQDSKFKCGSLYTNKEPFASTQYRAPKQYLREMNNQHSTKIPAF